MPNTYTHTTRAQFEQIMALRLCETASQPFVRFVADEIDLLTIEALRTFSALTGMWQDTQVQLVTAGSAFIDLPTLFPTLRGYTVLDQDLVGLIQYALLEPKNVSGWSGTEQYSLALVTQALRRRRDQFLLDTGCRITRHVPIPAFSGVIDPSDGGQVSLDPSIIDIRRAAWVTHDGKVVPLWTTSNWALRGASATWNAEPGRPRTYAYNQYAPSILQLAPPNADLGTLDLLTIDSGAPLDPTTGVLMGIPDDFTPFIKWGALADLYSADGPGRDFARADHCESMYQLGVQAAKSATVLVDARFNDRIAQFSSLVSLDAAPSMQYWQSKVGVPQFIAPVGLNLLAVALPPVMDVAFEATMVTNAPIPTAAGSYIQIPLEYLDLLVGYVEHLAMFKIGGREFSATQGLAEAFFKAAQQRNARLAAISVFEDDQRIFSTDQDRAKPRRIDQPEKKGAQS